MNDTGEGCQQPREFAGQRYIICGIAFCLWMYSGVFVHAGTVLLNLDTVVHNGRPLSPVMLFQTPIAEGDTLSLLFTARGSRLQSGTASCNIKAPVRLNYFSDGSSQGLIGIDDIDGFNDDLSLDIGFDEQGNVVPGSRAELTLRFKVDNVQEGMEELWLYTRDQQGNPLPFVTDCEDDADPQGISLAFSSGAYIDVFSARGEVGCVECAPFLLIDDRLENPDNFNRGEFVDALPGASFLKQQLVAATRISIENAHTRTRYISREIARRRNSEASYSTSQFRIRYQGQLINVGQLLAGNDYIGESRLGGFISGSVELGENDSNSSESDIEFGSSMFIVGLDYRFDHWVAGVALSINSAESDIAGVKNSAEITQSAASIFSSYFNESFYLDIVLSHSDNTFDFLRPVGLVGQTSGDTEGNDKSVALGAGYEGRVARTDYSLFLLYDRVTLEVDGFTEIGADALRVDSFDLTSEQLEAGFKLSYVFNTSLAVFNPYITLSYRSELVDDDWDVNVSLVSDISSSVILNNSADDEDYTALQLGLSTVFPMGVSAYLSYEQDVGRDLWSLERYDLGLRFEF